MSPSELGLAERALEQTDEDTGESLFPDELASRAPGSQALVEGRSRPGPSSTLSRGVFDPGPRISSALNGYRRTVPDRKNSAAPEDLAAPTVMPEESKLLIVTGAAASDALELPPLVQALIQSASQILVIAPVLPSRLQWLTSDTDRVREEADERLRTVVGQVEELAPAAAQSGDVGDETPLSAFADAVRSFRPDHILIALRAADHSAWQERDLLNRVRDGFHIPLTIFEIDQTGQVPTPASGPPGRPRT